MSTTSLGTASLGTASLGTASLGKAELFTRLAQSAREGPGNGAAVTVITPNLRLAQELGREFDAFQVARGLSVWGAPDILSFSAFVARAYEEALYSEGAARLPLLLAPAEEQALWEEVLGGSEENRPDANRNEGSTAGSTAGQTGLLALAQAASTARDAWKTVHEWRILERARRIPKNEDAEAFLRWAQRYERLTSQAAQTESARLPDVVADTLGDPRIAKPALLVRYGFDIVTAQQQAFFDAMAAAGSEVSTCSPVRREAKVERMRCLDARDEIRQAARWARHKLEEGGGGASRIGIVVPDLATRRSTLRREFSQAMGTQSGLATGAAAQPFNISLGAPLDEHPLVDAAFLILELAGREIAFDRASLLLRSPFIAGGDSEMLGRARLDAALRRRAEPELTLDRLLVLLRSNSTQPRVAGLQRMLEALSEFRKARLFGPRTPLEWSRAFSEALALAGFPGERALDSPEYQTLKKWHALVAQFAQLERVSGRMGYGNAVARLRRMAADTAFQPESPDVPVQILGVLESAGCEFDHLWVMGLSADAWPLAARPNPFIPVVLQREAGIPEASADASLELDRRITQGWLTAAREVVLSHPSRESDRELEPSPLIAAIAEGTLELPPFIPIRNAIFATGKLERVDEPSAPPVAPGDTRGGTLLIRDQAACPFRAFARHRLGSEALEAPHAGLDALERGSLVHQVLAAAWKELETKHALDTLSGTELKAMLEAAADAAVTRHKRHRPTTLSGRFAEIEKRRLARLALAWLDVERARGDFSVFAIEARRTIEIGGLRLSGRLDRVDETAQGERIVIDYKVSAPSAGAWIGERPDEPQLPLYLAATEPGARAIAFAQVKAGSMKWVALAADKNILPGARTLPNGQLKRAEQSWGEQVGAWRAELERLARGYAAGEALVDPKPGACEYCDQKPLCRIHERGDGRGDGRGEEEGGE